MATFFDITGLPGAHGDQNPPVLPVFSQPYTRELDIPVDIDTDGEPHAMENNNSCVTDFVTDGKQTGKTGETGVFQDFSNLTNEEFLKEIFQSVPEGASPAVASMPGDPTNKKTQNFKATALNSISGFARVSPPTLNNYLGVASFYPGEDGSFRAQKSCFAACHFLMLDDLGTKAPLERLGDVALSWLIETSPGNYQAGIIFDEPITDKNLSIRLLDAVIAAGLCDGGSNQALSKWARLPVAINGKAKHVREDGTPFQCRLVEWRPENRYAPQEIVDRLQLELAPSGRPGS